MGRRYTSTATLKGKMHVRAICEACGNTYDYTRELKTVKSQMNVGYYRIDPVKQQQAQVYHREMISKRYGKVLANVVEGSHFSFQRCPQCGYTQSWMLVAAKRDAARFAAAVVAIIMGGLVAVQGIMAHKEWGSAVCGLLPLLIVLPLVVYGATMRFYNPNRGKQALVAYNKPSIGFDPLVEFKLSKPVQLALPKEDEPMWRQRALGVWFGGGVIGAAICLIIGLLMGFDHFYLAAVAALVGGVLLAALLDVLFIPSIKERAKWFRAGVPLLGVGTLLVLSPAAKFTDQALVEWGIYSTMTAAIEPICAATDLAEANAVHHPLEKVWVHGATDANYVHLSRAEKVEDLSTLICVSEEPVTIQECPYTAEGSSRESTITRVVYQWNFRVIDWETKTLIFENSMFGGEPEDCPATYNASDDNANQTFYGGRPDGANVANWVNLYYNAANTDSPAIP